MGLSSQLHVIGFEMRKKVLLYDSSSIKAFVNTPISHYYLLVHLQARKPL